MRVGFGAGDGDCGLEGPGVWGRVGAPGEEGGELAPRGGMRANSSVMDRIGVSVGCGAWAAGMGRRCTSKKGRRVSMKCRGGMEYFGGQ